MTQSERWRPIPGWENCYAASDFGRIRSEDRTVETSNQHGRHVRTYRGRILKPYIDSDGRCQVNLRRAGVGGSVRVHQLVMLAFVGPCPEGMEVCHFDDDPSNNRLDNLRYDTSLANKQDMARNGSGNQNAHKTHCIRGHEYTPENTYIRTDGRTRDCRTCWTMRPSSYQPDGSSNRDKTHCVNGHEFTHENTYIYQKSNYTQRTCRQCALNRSAKRKKSL